MLYKIVAIVLLSFFTPLALSVVEKTQKPKLVNIKQKKLPVWELGLGLGFLSLSHYIGSNEKKEYAAPIPYFVYNGKILKADRKGVRGVLWQNGNLELNVSSRISMPVDSDDNKVRVGMPDLDFLLEIGPAVNYEFLSSDNRRHGFNFELPIRFASSFDHLSIKNQGFVINPLVEHRYFYDGWKSSLRIGPVIGSRKYNQYFYDVNSQYATIERQFYSAKKGIMAYRLSYNLSRRFDNWYIGAFFDYYDLADAANLESDLITSENSANLGFIIAWVFKQTY